MTFPGFILGSVFGDNGRGLSEATIKFQSSPSSIFTFTTLNNGCFISTLPYGTYTVTITHPSMPQPYIETNFIMTSLGQITKNFIVSTIKPYELRFSQSPDKNIQWDDMEECPGATNNFVLANPTEIKNVKQICLHFESFMNVKQIKLYHFTEPILPYLMHCNAFYSSDGSSWGIVGGNPSYTIYPESGQLSIIPFDQLIKYSIIVITPPSQLAIPSSTR